MTSLILVIAASWIVAGVLNRFLGNSRFGVIGIGVSILPLGLAVVCPIEPMVVGGSVLVGAGIFVLANRHKYFPKTS